MANSCRCGWQCSLCGKRRFLRKGPRSRLRLYAEDPAREFLPQSGRIARLDFPEAGPHVRVDTGVRAGDTIPIDYDPMLAKLIVWDEDRTAAVSRLRGALAETRVAGCATNVAFLRAIAGQQAFNEAALDTGFLEHHGGDLLALAKPAGTETLRWRSSDSSASGQYPHKGWPNGRPIPGALGTARTAGVSTSVRGKRCVCARSCPKGAAITPSKSLFCGMAGRLGLAGGSFFHTGGTLAPDGALTADLDGHCLKGVFVRSGQEMLVFPGAGSEHRFVVAGPLPGRRGEASRRHASPRRCRAVLRHCWSSLAPGSRQISRFSSSKR